MVNGKKWEQARALTLVTKQMFNLTLETRSCVFNAPRVELF